MNFSFDLQNSNVSDPSLDSYDLDQLADVVRCSSVVQSVTANDCSKVLVKKVYADKSIRNRRRQWKLKHLDVEDAASVNSTMERFVPRPARSFVHFFLRRDYTEFLEDLEEDAVLRQNVNVYKGNRPSLSLSPSTPFHSLLCR